MNRHFAFLLILWASAIVWGCASHVPGPNPTGAYRFADGTLIAITQGEKRSLRVREFQTGWSASMILRGDSWLAETRGGTSRSATIRFGDEGGSLEWIEPSATREARRVALPEIEAAFTSADGTQLTGKLILPESKGPAPGIVLVHGSGRDAATRTYYSGYFFAAHGIATLVYDKRGTGRSGGEFTSDFTALAQDAAAAVRWTRSRSEIDPLRVGLSGYSQGGWVAPLAAVASDAAFVIVNYGMIDSPAHEETVQTMIRLRDRGLDDAELEEAGALVEAATFVLSSGFKSGWKTFDDLALKYRNRPWISKLQGTTAGAFLRYPRWLVRLRGPATAPSGLDWNYESSATLRSLKIPVVWILGGQDSSAPNESSIAKIRGFQREGLAHELILFEDADHAMLRFELKDGERVYLGPEPRYFCTEVAVAMRLAGLGSSPSCDATGVATKIRSQTVRKGP